MNVASQVGSLKERAKGCDLALFIPGMLLFELSVATKELLRRSSLLCESVSWREDTAPIMVLRMLPGRRRS